MLVLRLNYCLIWIRAWLCTITTLLISSRTLLLHIQRYKICVQLQIKPEIKICQTELDNSSSSRTIMWNKVDSKHCVLIPGSVSHQNSARFSLEIVGLTFSYQSSNIMVWNCEIIFWENLGTMDALCGCWRQEWQILIAWITQVCKWTGQGRAQAKCFQTENVIPVKSECLPTITIFSKRLASLYLKVYWWVFDWFRQQTSSLVVLAVDWYMIYYGVYLGFGVHTCRSREKSVCNCPQLMEIFSKLEHQASTC